MAPRSFPSPEAQNDSSVLVPAEVEIVEEKAPVGELEPQEIKGESRKPTFGPAPEKETFEDNPKLTIYPVLMGEGGVDVRATKIAKDIEKLLDKNTGKPIPGQEQKYLIASLKLKILMKERFFPLDDTVPSDLLEMQIGTIKGRLADETYKGDRKRDEETLSLILDELKRRNSPSNPDVTISEEGVEVNKAMKLNASNGVWEGSGGTSKLSGVLRRLARGLGLVSAGQKGNEDSSYQKTILDGGQEEPKDKQREPSSDTSTDMKVRELLEMSYDDLEGEKLTEAIERVSKMISELRKGAASKEKLAQLRELFSKLTDKKYEVPSVGHKGDEVMA